MHNVGGENETEQLVQKSTPASPLAGRKEWAALRSCQSVVCHESQSADVCSVPRPNLHTPTVNLLPGNPLPLTSLCVCLSVCSVFFCVALTSSLTEHKRTWREKWLWPSLNKDFCQRNVHACIFNLIYIYVRGPSNHDAASLLCLVVEAIIVNIITQVFIYNKIC